MRILLVEGDESLARTLELHLQAKGFNVFTTELGEEAIDLIKAYDYDLAVVGLYLPDISGLDVLRHIRGSGVTTPVIMSSSVAGTTFKVSAFAAGCDDYLTTPIDIEELAARINAVVRRSKGHPSSVIAAGPIEVDTSAKKLRVNGWDVHLTAREYAMIELLALRRGQTITKESIMNHLYGGMDEPEMKIIDVFCCKLRKKIASANNGDSVIQTVWGRGYMLPAAPAQAAAA